MASKVTGASRKRTTASRTVRRVAERGRAERPLKEKPTAPKARSAAMRLAAEVDALKADLAQARARLAELETRVDEDPLTGLLNRRGFERALGRALAFVRRYNATAALVYLDLDQFKPVNDRHGHAAGDWVLGRLARLIAGNVRSSDVVGRVGGDEFVVLLWNVNDDQAVEKARGLETLIEGETFEYAGRPFAVGLSAGVVMLTAKETVEAALARADQAMYARKRERENYPSPLGEGGEPR
ncbi:MAG: GGDEF domain-containing protein [Xanthobacteraceae bacterium]